MRRSLINNVNKKLRHLPLPQMFAILSNLNDQMFDVCITESLPHVSFFYPFLSLQNRKTFSSPKLILFFDNRLW